MLPNNYGSNNNFIGESAYSEEYWNFTLQLDSKEGEGK